MSDGDKLEPRLTAWDLKVLAVLPAWDLGSARAERPNGMDPWDVGRALGDRNVGYIEGTLDALVHFHHATSTGAPGIRRAARRYWRCGTGWDRMSVQQAIAA